LPENRQRIGEVLGDFETRDQIESRVVAGFEAPREQVIAVRIAPAEIVAAIAHQAHEQAGAGAMVECRPHLAETPAQQRVHGIRQPQVAHDDAGVERGDRAVGIRFVQPMGILDRHVTARAATLVVRTVVAEYREFTERFGGTAAQLAGRHGLSSRTASAASRREAAAETGSMPWPMTPRQGAASERFNVTRFSLGCSRSGSMRLPIQPSNSQPSARIARAVSWAWLRQPSFSPTTRMTGNCRWRGMALTRSDSEIGASQPPTPSTTIASPCMIAMRSEERRVGK